ncbi:MAG: hypothetical protein IT169_18065 [Bryobacterales bacterium]|nr:hypothetical protein [Bryobacterales bacterium]
MNRGFTPDDENSRVVGHLKNQHVAAIFKRGSCEKTKKEGQEAVKKTNPSSETFLIGFVCSLVK